MCSVHRTSTATHHTATHHIAPHHTATHRTTPHHTAPHCTTPHHTTSHHTASHHTASHYTHHTTPHHTTLHHTTHTTLHTPHHTTPHHTAPHYTHHTAPHYTTPHHTTPHHTAPHYTTPHHTVLYRSLLLLLMQDFADFEPAVEPFKYLNIVYPDTIFIRLVFTQTETTLRHFCPCGKASAFECSQCTSRGYCGTDCQLEDWEREHGKECKRLAEKRRRTEVLGRRATVPALGSSTAEQQAGLVTPTSSMGRTPSRGSVQDWKGLLMSQRQASTFRPMGALTPIEEHPRLSQPPPSSEDTDAQTHVDRETLIMKPPPKMADPFAVPSKPPSAPLSARRLPPVRPSHIAVSPPGTAPSLSEQPMKPHDAQSYYWNRFKANTRKDAAQLPPVKPAPAPREFVPPQPLETSPSGFTPMGTTPGVGGVSPRPVGASPRPVGVLPHLTAQQTPVFTRPPMVFSRHPLPPSRGLSIHSVTSEDFDSSLNASQLRQSLRGEAVLEEDQSTSSDSDSSTESSSEEEESGLEEQGQPQS